MGSFEIALKNTKREEGGYNIDTNDHEVAYGLNRQWNGKWDGWGKIDAMKASGMKKSEISKAILKDQALMDSAKQYYKKNYYDPLRLDELQDQSLVNQAFDFSVNAGQDDARKNLLSVAKVNATDIDDNVLMQLNSKAVTKSGAMNQEFLNNRVSHNNATRHPPEIINQLNDRSKRIAFGADYVKRGIKTGEIQKQQDERFATAELVRYGEIERASMPEKLVAMWKQAKSSNDLFQVFEDYKLNGTGAKTIDRVIGAVDFGTEDTQWKSIVTDEVMAGQLQAQFNLPNAFYDDIRKTKNQAHFMALVDKHKKTVALDEFINSTLTTNEKVGASMASSMLLDPTNVVLPFLIPFKAGRAIMKATEKYDDAVRAAYTSEAGSQLSLNAAKAIYDYETKIAKTKGLALSGTLAATVPTMKYNHAQNYDASDVLLDSLFFGADMAFLRNQFKNADEAQRFLFDREYTAFHESRIAQAEKMKFERDNAFHYADDVTKAEKKAKEKELQGSFLAMSKIAEDIKAGVRPTEEAMAKYEKAVIKTIELEADIADMGLTLARTTETKALESIDSLSVIKESDAIKVDAHVTKQVVKWFVKNPIEVVAKEHGVNLTKIADEVGTNANAKISKDGKVTVQFKDKNGKDKKFTFDTKGNKAVLPTTVVLGILATTAQANASGDGFDVISTVGLGVLAFIGYKAVSGYGARRGAETFGKSLKLIGENAYSYVKNPNRVGVSDNQNRVLNMVENGARALNNRMIDTITPILTQEPDAAKAIARKLFYFSEKGDIFSAERIKKNEKNRFLQKFIIPINEMFEEAYKAHKNSIGFFDDVVNKIHKPKVFSDMRKQVTLTMMNPMMDSPTHIKNMAKMGRQIFDDINRMAEEAGVEGRKYLKNYVPYYFKNSNMKEILIRGGEEAENKLFEVLREMYLGGGVTLDKVDDLVSSLVMRFKQGDMNIIGGKNTITEDDIANRFKNRANMDMSRWKDFTIGDYKVSIDDLMELDLYNVADRYTNEMFGHIALARNGFPTHANAYEAVRNSGASDKAQREMNQAIDILIGKPPIDFNSDGAKLAAIGKNVAVPLFLTTGAVNMIQEVGTMAIKASPHKGSLMFMLSNLTKGLLSHGLDSKVVQDIIDYHAYGLEHEMGKISFRGYYDSLGNVGNPNTGFLDDAMDATTTLRDKTFVFNAMSKISTVLERTSVAMRANQLARYINGKEKIAPHLLEVYGISKADEDLLLPVLELNNKGHLKAFKTDEWTKEQLWAYDRIIDNMKLTDIQEHTMGGTPAWSRNSELGYAFSALLGFPMQAFSNHAMRLIKGTMRGSFESYAEAMVWFATGYAVYHAKMAIKGEEPDEDEAIKYAFMMMPMTGFEAGYSAFTNPIMPDAIDRTVSSPELLIEMVAE